MFGRLENIKKLIIGEGDVYMEPKSNRFHSLHLFMTRSTYNNTWYTVQLKDMPQDY